MATFTVTTALDESFEGTETIGTPDGTGLSLREAIGLANSTPGADTIVFHSGVFTGGTASMIRQTTGTELSVMVDNGQIVV